MPNSSRKYHRQNANKHFHCCLAVLSHRSTVKKRKFFLFNSQFRVMTYSHESWRHSRGDSTVFAYGNYNELKYVASIGSAQIIWHFDEMSNIKTWNTFPYYSFFVQTNQEHFVRNALNVVKQTHVQEKTLKSYGLHSNDRLMTYDWNTWLFRMWHYRVIGILGEIYRKVKWE